MTTGLAFLAGSLDYLPEVQRQRLSDVCEALPAGYPAVDALGATVAGTAARQLAAWHCPAEWIAAALLLAPNAALGEPAQPVQAAAGPDACALAARYDLLERQPLTMADAWRSQVSPPYRRLQKLFVASYLDEPVAFLSMAALLGQLAYLEQERPPDAPDLAANLQTALLPMLERYGLWNDRRSSADRLAHLADPAAADEVAALIREHAARRAEILEQVREGLRRAFGADAGLNVASHPVRASRVLEETRGLEMQRLTSDAAQLLRTLTGRLALDVRAPTDEMCYRVLGALHRLGRFAPGALRDYISAPRFNAYRMLHTRVRLAEHAAGATVDFFIGSEQAAGGNEYGRAAEWMDPAAGPLPGWWGNADRERHWLEAQRDASRAVQSLVFTPLGELHALPLHSPPLDFAFRIHTDLGAFYSEARINGVEARPGDRLATLDIVTVFFDPRLPAQLRPEWSAVTTSAASAGIKKQIRYRETSAARGRAALRQALEERCKRLGIVLSDARLRSYLDDAVRRARAGDQESFFIEIGRGVRSAEGIALRLVALEAAHLIRYADGRALDVPRQRVRLAGCCEPALETPIAGRISQPGTPHAAIKVHAATCPNARQDRNCVALAWHEPDYQGLYEYLALGSDRAGLLQEVLAPFYRGAYYLHKVVAERLDDCTAQFLILAETGDAARSADGAPDRGAGAPDRGAGAADRGAGAAQRIVSQLRGVPDIHEAAARPVALSAADLAARRLVLQRANPYPYNEPVYRGGEFVGRDRELDDVRAYLEAEHPNGPLIVHGPWRIGKTSLLRHIQEYDGHNFRGVAAYLNCQSIYNLDVPALCQAIATAVGERLQRETDRLAAHPLQLSREERQRLHEDPVPQLRGHLARVDAALRESRGLRLIVLIDEFSDLHDLVAEGRLSPRVFGNLRELISGTDVAFILAVQAKALARLAANPEHGGGLFEIAARCPVGPLAGDSSRRLLLNRGRSVGLSWEDEAVRQAVGLSGANPYMLNLLAHEAVRIVGETGEQLVTAHHLRLAVETALEEGRNGDLYLGHLALLIDTPGEAEVLRVLAGRADSRATEDDVLLSGPASRRPQRRDDLAHLLEKGLVVRERAAGVQPAIRLGVPLMGRWLAERRGEGEGGGRQ